ncbi:Methyl-CpG-binding domain protein 4-like protein [Drosera capensis]
MEVGEPWLPSAGRRRPSLVTPISNTPPPLLRWNLPAAPYPTRISESEEDKRHEPSWRHVWFMTPTPNALWGMISEAYHKNTEDNTWEPAKFKVELPQHDPWRDFVICMLLSYARDKQVKDIFSDFFAPCPDAQTAVANNKVNSK